MLTQARLKELLNYNSETGIFTWRVSIRQVKAGDEAGSTWRYIRIGVDGRTYPAHRLAWLYVHGEFPKIEIDHKDRCKTNNSFLNLRLATRSQNQNNIPARKGSATGVKGVTWNKNAGKYQAQIKIDGKSKYLGIFKSLAAAKVAYAREAITAHGSFSCGVQA